MNGKSYAYRREDTGEIVWVDWDTMMWQQQGGFITLPDGVSAKRCVHLEKHRDRPKSLPMEGNANRTPAPSDCLGFPQQCLKQRRAELQQHGLTDVEFRRDPTCPEFYQVHCGSQAAKDRYTKCRRLVNRTGSLGGGVMLSPEELARAAELVSR